MILEWADRIRCLTKKICRYQTNRWWDIPLHKSSGKCGLKQDATLQLLELQKCRTLTTLNAGKDSKWKEFSSIASGTAKWSPHSRVCLAAFLFSFIFFSSIKVNTLSSYNRRVIMSFGIYPNGLETYVLTKCCVQLFTAASFMTAKT